MPSSQTTESKTIHFFGLTQRQNPLAGLQLLRDPQIWDNNNNRPFSPGLGNESDAFLRFYQKPFFNARKAGQPDPCWSPRFPHTHFVSKSLVEDYSAIPKSAFTSADDEVLESEELRAFLQSEMAAERQPSTRGGDSHIAHTEAEAELKTDERQADTAKPNNDFVNTNTNLEIHQPRPSYSLRSSNDMNRAAGRSYLYTFDDSDDAEDEDEQDDDYHLYSQAEPAMSNQGPASLSSDGDTNINYSDPDSNSDVDASDDDTYFSHVAVAGPSTNNYAISKESIGDGGHNSSNIPPMCNSNTSQRTNVPTLPTILEQDEYEVNAQSQPHTLMTSFVTAYQNDTVAHLVQDLIADVGKWNNRFCQLSINHLSLIRQQSHKLDSCTWLLIPLESSDNAVYPTFTGAPTVILTSPDGQKFDLEEREYDFSGANWDAWWIEREQLNREAEIDLREYRDMQETQEEYSQALAARTYWANAQEERDEYIWWQDVNTRAVAAQEREEAATVAGDEGQEVQDDKDLQTEPVSADGGDYGGSQQTASEPDMSTSLYRGPLERRLTDPEIYCQINQCNMDSENQNEEGD